MKSFFTICLSIVISLTFAQRNNKVKFLELSYGITKSEILSKKHLENSPSGNHLVTHSTTIIEKTDSIPALLGNQFAIVYKLKHKKTRNVDVNIFWKYPAGMKDVNGRNITETSYVVKKCTNSETNSNYTFETENELVKGVWTFLMKVDGEIIYEKEFYLF